MPMRLTRALRSPGCTGDEFYGYSREGTERSWHRCVSLRISVDLSSVNPSLPRHWTEDIRCYQHQGTLVEPRAINSSPLPFRVWGIQSSPPCSSSSPVPSHVRYVRNGRFAFGRDSARGIKEFACRAGRRPRDQQRFHANDTSFSPSCIVLHIDYAMSLTRMRRERATSVNRP